MEEGGDLYGFFSSCWTVVTVKNKLGVTLPVPVCESYKTVSLAPNQTAKLKAESFDNGSYDPGNNSIYFKTLRVKNNTYSQYDGGCSNLNGDDDPSTNTIDVWYDDNVYYCSEDEGKTIPSGMRVFNKDPGNGPVDPARMEEGGDLHGHYSDCITKVFVKYKLNSNITAVCEKYIQINIDIQGKGKINAENFDDSSFSSNNNKVYFKVMRSENLSQYDGGCSDLNGDDDPSTNIMDVWFDDNVYYCCEDVNKEIFTTLLVFDKNPGNGAIDPLRIQYGGDLFGHYSNCITSVTVHNTIPPSIQCKDFNVNCTESLDPEINTKLKPEVFSVCGHELEYNDQVFSIPNGTKIIRKWTASANDKSAYCYQIIKVEATQSFDPCTIQFPEDVQMDCIDNLSNAPKPTWDESSCNVVTAKFEDDTFTYTNNSYYKIVRNWAIIDWLLYKPNHGSENNIDILEGKKLNCNQLVEDGYYRYKQIIKINFNTDSTLTIKCNEVNITCSESLDPEINTKLKPEVSGMCEYTLDYSDQRYIDVCSTKIIRLWTATGNDKSVQCSQIIRVEAEAPFNPCTIQFPEDIVADCTNAAGEPRWDETSCNVVTAEFADDTFNFVDSSYYKIVRNWTVIDWCLYKPNYGSEDNIDILQGTKLNCNQLVEDGYYKYKQIIRINYNNDSTLTIKCKEVNVNCSESLDPEINTKLKPEVSGTCEYELFYIDQRYLDVCSTKIIRNWTAVENGKLAECKQIIRVEAEKPFDPCTIQFPEDIVADCIEDLVEAGKPKWDETSCNVVTAEFADDTFIIESNYYKIVRNWAVVDWCLYKPNYNSENNIDIIQGEKLNCNQLVKDGYYRYSQVIIVNDTIAPIPVLVDKATVVMNDGYSDIKARTYDKGGCGIGCISSFDNCTTSNNLAFSYSEFIPHISIDKEKWDKQFAKYGKYYFSPKTGLISTEAKYLEGIADAWLPSQNTTQRRYLCKDYSGINKIKVYVWDRMSYYNNIFNSFNYGVVDVDFKNCGNGISSSNDEIKTTKLYQNTPNPFTEKTKIRFELPNNSKYNLSIFDINGVLIYSESEMGKEGKNSVEIDGQTFSNMTGIFFYKLESESFVEIKKMMKF